MFRFAARLSLSLAVLSLIAGAQINPALASSASGNLQYIKTNDKGFKEYRNPRDGATMVLILAGEFIMGSQARKGPSNEFPQHEIYLDAYYINKYDVTNQEFAKFVNKTGYSAEGSWRDYAKMGREKHPVIDVSWNDALAYCKWAGGRLPTEAEWEKAARGAGGEEYPWGWIFDGEECNWFKGPAVSGMADIYMGRGTTPVDSFPSGASPYGCLDMAGNVCQWCNDWYDKAYYHNSPSKNPKGPSNGKCRVYRGGSWFNEAYYLRCAYRAWRSPYHGLKVIGFRVCRSFNKSNTR